MIKKYILWPGVVVSVNDGQRHFVSGSQLAALYGVSVSQCLLPMAGASANATWSNSRLAGRTDLIHLFPRDDGDYTLPT